MLLLLLPALLLIFFISQVNKTRDNANTNIGSKLGQYAPDFEIEYLNGTRASLHELMRGPVILNFWATWCPPCIREMRTLQEFQEKHENEITVLGVNLGEKEETIERFLERTNITLSIAIDRNKSIEKSYNVIIRPSTFFVDKNGIIADKRLGEMTKQELEEKIEKVTKR